MSQALQLPSVGFSLASGLEQSRGLKTQARSLEDAARIERLRGKQISAARREELVTSLSALDAFRAGSGLSVDSPSALAARDRVLSDAFEAENADLLGSNLREQSLLQQAASRRRAAPFAVLGGVTQALSGLAEIAQNSAPSGEESAKGGGS